MIRLPRALAAALSLGLLVWPETAQAEPKDDARRYFTTGLEAAERGDYDAAIKAFLAAQAAYPHPSTVYNIARAYEDMGDPVNALIWYQRFAEDQPARAADVAEPIRRLTALTAPPPAPVVAPATAPAPSATAEELDRLDRMAAEMAALVEALRARADEAPAGAVPADSPPPDALPADEPTDPTTAAPDVVVPPADNAFLTEAYERVVYTASRYGQDPLDSPSTITVLTEDDIRLSGATNLADLLRRVPGVDVMSLASTSNSVGVRGFNSEISNKVLWLIDGRTIYWDFLAAPLPLNLSIAMEEIERVEIIRGAGSAIYGANAVTGVINIITREPGKGPSQLLKFSAGAPDFLQGTLLSSGRKGEVSWRVSAGYDQEGRWAKEPYDLEDDAPVVPFFENQELAGRKVRGNARLDWGFLDKGFASLQGGYTNGQIEYYNLGALGNYAVKGNTHHLRGDLAYGPVRLFTFWNHEAVDTGPWFQAVDPPRDLNASVKSDVINVEVEGNIPVQTGDVKHQINVGAGYRYKNIKFDYLSGGFDQPWVEHHAWAFAQEQLSWRWLSAVVSLRLDRHPLVPISRTLSPRGALIFRVAKDTSLRVSAGTAYRAMNHVESYMDFNLNTSAPGYFIRDFGGEVTPNGDGLVPERVINVEIGAHDESSVFHAADVAIYWNRVTDLIGLEGVTPTLEAFDTDSGGFQAGTTGWINNSDLVYDAFGGEADLRVFPVDGLDVFTNIAIERIFERGPDGTVVDGSTSLAKVNLGAMYRAPFRTDFTLMGHYVSPQAWRLREFDDAGELVVNTDEIPARFLLSARIAARPIPKRDLELALTLWNPLGFGKGFQEHPKGQPVGARLFGSVSLAF